MFFPRRRRTEVLPVGVDVGPDRLRLIQLRVTPTPAAGPRPSNPLTVAAWHAVPLPEPGSDGAAGVASASARAAEGAAAILPALRRGGFAGRDVVAALPAGLVHVRTFRAPPGPPDERDAALRQQARQGAPFGDSEPLHAEAVSVGEARQGRDVRDEFLAVAARDADVRAFLEAAGSGVTVRSLQAEPYAVYRAAAGAAVCGAAVCAERGATHAVVHVGEAETLVLIGAGPRLRVVRRVDVGAARLDGAVAARLSVTPAEARHLRRRSSLLINSSGGAGAADPVRLAIQDATRPLVEEVAREAAMCVRYHAVSFRSPLPASIRLLGCDAADPQVRSLLAASTGLPVDGRGVLDAVAGWTGEDDGGWAVALGLALAFAPERTDSPASDAPTNTPTGAAAAAVGEAACA